MAYSNGYAGGYAGAAAPGGTIPAPDNLNAIAALLGSSLETGLLGYLVEAGASEVTDVVGALNELNSTEGVGFQEAYDTWISSL